MDSASDDIRPRASSAESPSYGPGAPRGGAAAPSADDESAPPFEPRGPALFVSEPTEEVRLREEEEDPTPLPEEMPKEEGTAELERRRLYDLLAPVVMIVTDPQRQDFALRIAVRLLWLSTAAPLHNYRSRAV